MDFENDFLLNPFSYILGAVSVVGFLVVARNEVSLWFEKLFSKFRSANSADASIPMQGRNIHDILQPARKMETILGLILMGLVFSDAIFISHVRTEQIEPSINFNSFLLIMFVLTMFPGGLAGVAAVAWINATSRIHHSHLLGSLLVGILVYIVFVTLVEYTEIHLFLFLCGPVITLLVYRFLPLEL